MLLLEHPPTITLGRRTEPGEVHVPDGAEVEIVEVDRGGKSTYHAPGQLVCYPILDLTRHGQDVKRYCRDLEEALIRTIAAFDVEATRIDGLTGVWLEAPAAQDRLDRHPHLTKWVTTHGYALNVDLDPAPFTDWITACGLDGYAFTTIARELGRPVASTTFGRRQHRRSRTCSGWPSTTSRSICRSSPGARSLLKLSGCMPIMFGWRQHCSSSPGRA